MNRETLRQHLHNRPLVEAIRQKVEIGKIKNKLHDAYSTALETGMSDTVCVELKIKYDEYKNIHKAYGNMLEDAWGITWQREGVIRKYLEYDDADIDRLPVEVRVRQ